MHERVEHHEHEADEPRDQAAGELRGSERRRDDVRALQREAERQGAELELVGQRLGALLREVARDGGLAVGDDALRDRGGDDLVVEHERELVAWGLERDQAGRHVAELLRAVAVEDQVDRPRAGADALARLLEAARRVGDRAAVDLDRAEDVLRGAVVGAGDDRAVGGGGLPVVLGGGRAVVRGELGLEAGGDPRDVARARGLRGRLVGEGGGIRGGLRGRGLGCGSGAIRGSRPISGRGRGRRGDRGRAGRADEHGAELELRRRLQALHGRRVGLTGQADDDVAAALRGDLRLGDAARVDALADDGDGLRELLARGPGGGSVELRREDDLRAALEVERELGAPRAVAERDARGVAAGQEADDDQQPDELAPGLAYRCGRLGHLDTRLSSRWAGGIRAALRMEG